MNLLKKFWGMFFSWNLAPSSERQLQSADVILALAHGLERDPSNAAIAQIAVELSRQFGIPIIAQHQLSPFLPEACPIGEDKGYLNRHEVIELMKEVCDRRHYQRVIIVSHGFACWLSIHCAQKLGLEALIVDTSSVPHSPKSTHWWIRNSWFLAPYDILARVWFLFHRWI